MPSLGTFIVLLAISSSIIPYESVSGVIIDKCKAAKALIEAQKQGINIQRCFLKCLVCVMERDGDFNTAKKTGPGSGSTYKHGIFQIQSSNHCGLTLNEGLCKKQCKYFLDENLTDDIECAVKIMNRDGLKYWPGYMKYCSKNPAKLPDLSKCGIKKEDIDLITELLEDSTCGIVNCPQEKFMDDGEEEEFASPEVFEWDSIEEFKQVHF